MKSIRIQFLFFALFVLTATQAVVAGKPTNTNHATGLAKTATNAVYSPMDINNIFNYYSNNGDGSFNRLQRMMKASNSR